mgnify:CR=1 FL=1
MRFVSLKTLKASYRISCRLEQAEDGFQRQNDRFQASTLLDTMYIMLNHISKKSYVSTDFGH